MYEVMLVILNRPFVSDGHLHSKDNPTVAIDSFSTCVNAANSIVALLSIYDREFSIRRAPYLIAYATYVAATIHVRVAAQLEPSSNAHAMLQFCLCVFDQNRETNSAVKRAELVIHDLIKRMGVRTTERTHEIEQTGRNEGQHSPPTVSEYQQADFAGVTNETLDIDIDMVIQSFNPHGITWTGQTQATEVMNVEQGYTSHMSNTDQALPTYGHRHSLDFHAAASSHQPMYDLLVGFSGSPDDNFWAGNSSYEQSSFD